MRVTRARKSLRFIMVAAAAATGACSFGRPAAVAPSSRPADRPAPEVAAEPPIATAPAPAPGACCQADTTPTPTPPTPAPTPTPAPAEPAPVRPRSPADRVPDSLSAEEAFLDSLRTLRPDSSAPARTAVAREEVRQEAAELLGRPQGAAAAATWDIDVTTYAAHDRVQYYMDYFTGRARWHFERYLERAGRYDSMIRTRLLAAGLPQDLIYLAMIESGFNQTVRSRAGAVGIWQFIPATGRRYGLTVDSWVDDRRDPFLATDAAIRFLSELNNRFGSLYLAAAAYNSGPGKIQRGLQRYDFGALNGDAQFFALADGTFLRRETRDYVPKLIAAALLAKEPGRYGFANLDRWTPLRYDSAEVRFAVSLDVLARVADTERDHIEEMNPRFFRGVTPPDRRVWARVPPGTADSVAARLERLPARDRVTVLVHSVVRGETLGRIAQRYRVTIAEIRAANRNLGQYLRVGERLVIPGAVMSAGGGGRHRPAGRCRAAGARREHDPFARARDDRALDLASGGSAGPGGRERAGVAARHRRPRAPRAHRSAGRDPVGDFAELQRVAGSPAAAERALDAQPDPAGTSHQDSGELTFHSPVRPPDFSTRCRPPISIAGSAALHMS